MADVFSNGDEVTVSYKGTVHGSKVLNSGLGTCYIIRTGEGFEHAVHVYGSEGVITRNGPKEWPPQKGDIWVAAGTEWFACETSSNSITMMPADISKYLCDSAEKFIASHPRARIKIRGSRVYA